MDSPDFEEYEEEERVRGSAGRKGAGAAKTFDTRQGQVIAIGPRGCRVRTGESEVSCRPKAGIAPGDMIAFDSTGQIREVLPRRTTLSRPDPMNPRIERVIAANIDIVVMVASIRAPDLRPGLIDRYLIAIEKGGAEPVLCLTKMDLAASEAYLRPVAPYRELGVQVFEISIRTGMGIGTLRDALRGKLSVLVGHSGVGKSSLLNALAPHALAETRAISEASGKGVHTTTGSSLHEADGVRIIDTPGVREFGLWKITAAEVLRSFREFEPFAAECQFADCSHTHEPVCGVKEAADSGRISRARFEAYLRLLGTLGD